jgi:adenylosuccinate synthase
MVVLKVVKIIVKIIKKLIKFIPARWSTVGKIQKITEVLEGWEEGIQTAIDTSKKY